MRLKLENIFIEILKPKTQPPNIVKDTCPEWDSLRHINLIVEIESQFQITLSPEEMAEIHSFESALRIVQAKVVT
jgi:acyl carrier protein